LLRAANASPGTMSARVGKSHASLGRRSMPIERSKNFVGRTALDGRAKPSGVFVPYLDEAVTPGKENRLQA
jgi:hypothetical protein